MKTKIIIFILAIIVMTGVVWQLTSFEQPNEKKLSTDGVKQQLTTIIEKEFTNPQITKKSLEKQLDTKISSNILILGPDAAIMSFPDESLKKKYHLQNYIKKQKQFAKKIQQEFKKRFSYSLVNTEKIGSTIKQSINIITIYYGLYSSDLDLLVNEMMKYKNYDMKYVERSEKLQMELYKIRVLAMEVLNNHFDIYCNNSNESRKVEIIYEKGKPKTADELFSLLCNINGLTYPNVDFSIPANVDEQKERINTYLKEIKWPKNK